MWTVLVLALSILLSGCIIMGSHVQPIKDSIPDTSSGTDCVMTVFNIGGGTNTIEAAARKALPRPVKAIRSVELLTVVVLFFGHQCLEVHGADYDASDGPVLRPVF